jgi:hypothetical protein
MSAPMIIPFNFQPVNTGSTTGTYTVPAGKYARAYIKNCLLPVLNGTSLYYSKNFGGTSMYTTATSQNEHVFPETKCHRVTLGIQSSTAQTVYIKLGIGGSVVNGVDNHFTMSTNSSASYNLTSSTVLSGFKSATNSGNCWFTSIILDVCEIDELWLKAGDAVSHSGGVIVYQEYNVIS